MSGGGAEQKQGKHGEGWILDITDIFPTFARLKQRGHPASYRNRTMNKARPILHGLRFRRWSRKQYAAFASMGRHVTIGHVCNSIADRSLKKQLHSGTSGRQGNTCTALSKGIDPGVPWELPPELAGQALYALSDAARSTGQSIARTSSPAGCEDHAAGQGSMPIRKTGHTGGHKLTGMDKIPTFASAYARLFICERTVSTIYPIHKP